MTLNEILSNIKQLKDRIANYNELSNIINLNECKYYMMLKNTLHLYNSGGILFTCEVTKVDSKFYISRIYNRGIRSIGNEIYNKDLVIKLR